MRKEQNVQSANNLKHIKKGTIKTISTADCLLSKIKTWQKEVNLVINEYLCIPLPVMLVKKYFANAHVFWGYFGIFIVSQVWKIQDVNGHPLLQYSEFLPSAALPVQSP